MLIVVLCEDNGWKDQLGRSPGAICFFFEGLSLGSAALVGEGGIGNGK